MKKTGILVCGMLLLALAVLGAGCVDNGIATDHANESIVGAWICPQGLANDTIVIVFNPDGTADLEDTLEDLSVLTNSYTWNRQEALNRYIAVSSSGERVGIIWHPDTQTLEDNAGNIFEKLL